MQIKVNGITLTLEDHGAKTAPAMILIRGLGTQLVHWPDELIHGFVAQGFRTIVFDNRDVGLSARLDEANTPSEADDILALARAGREIPAAYSLTDMAEDVIGLMDHLELESAHIFGISMGGAIAQILALNHPERLLSATLVMTTCRPLLERGAIAELLPKLLAREPASLEAAQTALIAEYGVWGSPGYPADDTYIRAQAQAAYKRGGPQAAGLNRQLIATLNAPDRRAALQNLHLPCCVIHGLQDSLIPPEHGAELAAHIPNSVYHPVEGMGHIITPRLAPEIVQLVSEFVRKLA
ncbi:alpha/beta fold hydrolase [uncultured Lentibacter sp.]|jgi:pimeloyl-ACP methyl ester carboxylesterase|uniref:alpha/beta fold hydrolase n=1 Tax=uncultured Lentibacter sp. TaxID=1659309 RepID=UPI00263540A1|nr:alpha/beta fold hydrolase [uncultured Lentibacter sp.]